MCKKYHLSEVHDETTQATLSRCPTAEVRQDRKGYVEAEVTIDGFHHSKKVQLHRLVAIDQ